VALLLIPVDLALSDDGADHPDVFVADTRIKCQIIQGVGVETDVDPEELIILQPLWADVARVAVPLVVLGALAALGWIDRRDVGLTGGGRVSPRSGWSPRRWSFPRSAWS
jgi:hypothetical protein